MTREEKEDEFLRLLGEGYKVRAAANLVGIAWSSLYIKRQQDEVFRKKWIDAKAIKIEHLVCEAERRAMQGSDKLLIFLLSNYAPDKFKNTNNLAITNPDGSLTKSVEDRAAETKALFAIAAARKSAKAIEDLL